MSAVEVTRGARHDAMLSMAGVMVHKGAQSQPFAVTARALGRLILMLSMSVTEIVRELEPVAPDPLIAPLEAMRPRPTGPAGLIDTRGGSPAAEPAR